MLFLIPDLLTPFFFFCQPECLSLTPFQRDLLDVMYCTFERTFFEHPESAEHNFMDSLSLGMFDYIVYLGDQIINARLKQLVSYLTLRLEEEEGDEQKGRKDGWKGGRKDGRKGGRVIMSLLQ